VSNKQEGGMDLWATLGISREVGIGAVVVGLVLAVIVAGRILRRSRKDERVWVDLSGRG
jgi:hypothetical protein